MWVIDNLSTQLYHIFKKYLSVAMVVISGMTFDKLLYKCRKLIICKKIDVLVYTDYFLLVFR